MNTKGYRIFLTIWIGQLVSQLGTAVTRFALIIWAYQQTDSTTAVALLGFCAFVPMIVISPFAGVWVDRLDRRKVMLYADVGAGLATLALMLLFATDQLELWHLYIIEALSGLFEAFQSPAYTTLTDIVSRVVGFLGSRKSIRYGNGLEFDAASNSIEQ